jgi:hypothetical protein
VIDGHARRREAHIARLRRYIDLERRWFELTGPSAGGPELGDQLVRAANLVCSTYADTDFLAAEPAAGASGGAAQARHAGTPGTGPADAGGPHTSDPATGVTAVRRAAPDFDTLIVDQAARLRDSEFLVGAVRARRWILVGDDSDPAPPIRLGTADEHELLAAAALAAEPAADPASTIADMTVTTRPPDGLPTEGVRAAARRLRADQSRAAGHEAAITAARARTPDPAAALVGAVHGHRTPDFFTARLSGLPAALRRRFSAPAPGEGE